MPVITLTIDGNLVSGRSGQTVLEVARDAGVTIPTLCWLEGLEPWGGCRLCVVELAGEKRLFTACTTQAQEGMDVTTRSGRLDNYRRMLVELLLAERTHICSVCVVNGHCELQSLAAHLGVDHVRFDYLFPHLPLDTSHERFGLDHNRCIMCTRCVRVCDAVEGAHTWDVRGRGVTERVVIDLDRPWGESTTCTDCSKCVKVCPVGALFTKGVTVGEMVKDHSFLQDILRRRKSRDPGIERRGTT
jgi:bidirectional [NiFe] hydrogenase diaphorase subunit